VHHLADAFDRERPNRLTQHELGQTRRSGDLRQDPQRGDVYDDLLQRSARDEFIA
jgi:hypothetical protein